jgi:hypothetical protein
LRRTRREVQWPIRLGPPCIILRVELPAACRPTATVSGLLLAPESLSACYVMAHGAGAGMAHLFMAAVENSSILSE